MAKYKKALVATALLVWLVAGIVATLYIGGFLFLLFAKTNPLHAGLGTWWEYWSFYHHIPSVKKRLIIGMLIGLVVSFGIPPLVYAKLTEVRKTLFGEARFATIAEIRKAGLLR